MGDDTCCGKNRIRVTLQYPGRKLDVVGIVLYELLPPRPKHRGLAPPVLVMAVHNVVAESQAFSGPFHSRADEPHSILAEHSRCLYPLQELVKVAHSAAQLAPLARQRDKLVRLEALQPENSPGHLLLKERAGPDKVADRTQDIPRWILDGLDPKLG